MEAHPQPNRGRAVLFVNQAFSDLTGYSAEEVLGRSLHFLRGPRTDDATLAAMRQCLDAVKPFRGELLNYHKDGRELWVSLSLVPVLRPAGDCEHFVMIQRDITQQKRAEQALQDSEMRFRSIFEMAGGGVSLTNAEGIFTACNPAFASLVGRSMAEVLGRHASEFTHPDDWAEQQHLIDKILANEIKQFALRKRYVKPDGSITWCELSLVAITGLDGSYQGGLGISVDVTQRLALQEQLQQSQKMEALGQLAGGVAHDFNNLLTAILGNLALIQIEPHHPAAQLLRTVELATTRAADLTRKLLGYSRRNQLIRALVRPSELMGEVVDILHRTLDPRIQLTTEIHCDQPVVVDTTLLHQCLFNLCLNARDAMPHGGRITLGTEFVEQPTGPSGEVRSGAYLRIHVADTGTGMTEEVKQRVFEPFFTTKGVGRGTGLGLPMVQGIIQQHGGWVTLESQVGVGTRFDLYLPFVNSPLSTANDIPTRLPTSLSAVTPPPIAKLPPLTQSARILLVDDESMIRTLARAILETRGYDVVEAEDGQEAVELFQKSHEDIDLVILDLTMPRLSGRDAYQQISQIDPEMRVLFSSGYSSEDLSDVEGAIGLLSKPYRPHDLLSAVSRALDEDSRATAG
jgi:PAS domain S-box-containing protein